MRRLIFITLSIIIALMITGVFVHAEVSASSDSLLSSASVAVPSQSPAVNPIPSSSVTPEANPTAGVSTSKAGIAPDNILYSIDKMIESIQVTLTFSEEGKAQLLVGFANERLAEAVVMTDKKNAKLAKKVMQAYFKTLEKANERIKDADEDDEIKPAIEEIKITEGNAEKIIIQMTLDNNIPKETSQVLKKEIENTVKKTLAVEAFAEAKAKFFEAKKELEQAKRGLKAAKKTGDAALIKAAEDKVILAEKNKDAMEKTKDAVEAKKEEIKDTAENSIKADEKEENEQQKLTEEIKDKAEKETEKKAREKQKLEEKIKKEAEKQLKKDEKAKEKMKKEAEKANKKNLKKENEDDTDE